MNQKKSTKKVSSTKKSVEGSKEGGAYCTHPGCGWTGPISAGPDHQAQTGHSVDW